MAEDRPRTLARRLHSLSGVVPVGAFLVLHLCANASAARGPEAYDETARRLRELPLAVALEILFVALPLGFHGVYGLFVAAVEPRGAAGAGDARRGLAAFQRVTGILLFGFLLFHVWTTRLVQVHDHGELDLFRLMQALCASPWIRAAYVAGLLGAAAHFAAGLFTFADTWGLVRTRFARVAAAAASAGIFAALSVLGLRSLSAFRL